MGVLKGFVALVVLVATGGWVEEDRIVRRHDRPDSAYVALGARFPAVGQLGGGMGDGTLVAPQWVLTAAHVADAMLRRGSKSVVLEGTEYVASEIILHPDWSPMSFDDFALIHLTEPVDGITPLPLYEGSDELGRIATFVGHGMSGDGLVGPIGEDRIRRAATNRIERADTRVIVFHFDEGEDATDLEGIPGPGDSGGPAVIEVGGDYVIVGVSSAGEPGRDGPGTYGANDYFGRVSTHLDWIREVMSR